MMRSAPICFAESTPRSPTAPSPTTTTVAPGFHVRCIGGKPAGAHHVRQGEHAGDVVGIGYVASRDECAVGERHAQSWRLCAADRRPALAGGLIPMPAMRARV